MFEYQYFGSKSNFLPDFLPFYPVFVEILFTKMKKRSICYEFDESLFTAALFDPFLIFSAGVFHLFKKKKKKIKKFSNQKYFEPDFKNI